MIQEDRHEVALTISFVTAGPEDGQVRCQSCELSVSRGVKVTTVFVLRWKRQVAAL